MFPVMPGLEIMRDARGESSFYAFYQCNKAFYDLRGDLDLVVGSREYYDV